MVIPQNWNDIVKSDIENNIALPLGGHICKVVDIEEYTSKNGNQSLKILFDIADENEFKDCFQKIYNAADNFLNRNWANEGTRYLSLKEENLSYLKEFIEVIEKSNDIKINVQIGVDLDLSQFKGLLVAGQFGLEEYADKNDEVKTTVSLFRFRNLDELESIKIPKVKLLDGSYLDYEEYRKNRL